MKAEGRGLQPASSNSGCLSFSFDQVSVFVFLSPSTHCLTERRRPPPAVTHVKRWVQRGSDSSRLMARFTSSLPHRLCSLASGVRFTCARQAFIPAQTRLHKLQLVVSDGQEVCLFPSSCFQMFDGNTRENLQQLDQKTKSNF